VFGIISGLEQDLLAFVLEHMHGIHELGVEKAGSDHMLMRESGLFQWYRFASGRTSSASQWLTLHLPIKTAYLLVVVVPQQE
jgi:hypothetical protein